MGLIMWDVDDELAKRVCKGCIYKTRCGSTHTCENEIDGGYPDENGCKGWSDKPEPYDPDRPVIEFRMEDLL